MSLLVLKWFSQIDLGKSRKVFFYTARTLSILTRILIVYVHNSPFILIDYVQLKYFLLCVTVISEVRSLSSANAAKSLPPPPAPIAKPAAPPPKPVSYNRRDFYQYFYFTI